MFWICVEIYADSMFLFFRCQDFWPFQPNSLFQAEVDCHTSIIGSLKRLLVRHKLRQPLTIDDVSKGGPAAVTP